MNDTIKMFIAGEEVVSNSDFTINEEMLSASSTILNNCYPKSWEIDKDYVSNFYFPKDYSKFILANGEYLHGNSEYAILTESGSNPFYTTNVEKEWNSLNVYGNTYQKTSESPVMPSPDYPSELESVGYENLFNNNDTYYKRSSTTNIVTIEDNKITFQNTNTSTVGLAWWNIPVEVGKTITINYEKIEETTENANNRVQYLFSDTILTSYSSAINNSTPIDKTTKFTTVKATEKYLILILRAPTNSSYTITNLQVITGNENSLYIPYGKYGIEIKSIGKNLFSSEMELGTINSSGVPNSNNNAIRTRDYIEVQPNTEYTVKNSLDYANYRYEYDENLQFLGFTSSNNNPLTFTTRENTKYIKFRTVAGKVENDLSCKWQLERGNQATTYETHRSNSQLYILDEPLRAIGDYKDRLFIQDGVLYVERKIGSVILNGSENWQLAGTDTNTYRFVAKNSLSQNALNYLVDNFKNNYFKEFEGNSGIGYPTDEEGIAIRNDLTGLTIRLAKTRVNDLAEFQTWLSTHNTEVIYVLNEPTITPIGYVNIPNAYEGQNTTYLYTGLTTTMDVLYYWKNFNVLFAGVVKNTGDISLNPRYPHYCSLQILDYKTFLSESNTLDFVIANKTIAEAITMVVNAVSNYGFEVGTINIAGANDIIGAYSTLNKSAYDVLQYLAEISGSRWRTRYIDSSSMAIDFYDPDTLPQAIDIDYTKQYWEDNNIIDLTFNYSTRDYRNKQILLSDEVYANINYNETLISNGYSNTFTLQNNVGNIISIIVNNQEKTFVTTNDKQMGIDADFYYSPGKNTLESNVIYPAGTMIYLTYQPLVKGRQIVYNSSEVERISEQTDTEGVIARYESRNDILSSDELEKIAQTYIEYKGKAEVILTLRTQNKDLYNVGEVVYFDAPIDDLKQNYMVKTKRINYIVVNSILSLFYEYELTSSFNSEKAINYFDNQRNKASGNISSGDSITRNIDIETDVNIIWNNGTISNASITIDGDNELNSILNSPFID